MKATATHLSNGTTEIRFPYRAWAVQQLKAAVPASCRSYDPDEKAWYVVHEWEFAAIEVLEFAFGEVTVEYAAGSRSGPTPIRTSDADYRALHLLPSAPAELVQAAYRCLARVNHPDKGGSNEVMKQVNLAFEALRKVGAA